MPRLLALALLLTSCAGSSKEETGPPPTCDHVPRPARSLRLFAVGHKLLFENAESYQSYEAAVRATVEREVVPHLADDRPNVLVFPENMGLTAAFLGPRGAEAREASGATAGYLDLQSAWRQAFDHYKEVAPLSALGKWILLATTDPTWRAFDRTFSGIAREQEAYVIASLDIGDVEEMDAKDVAELAGALGDPERPDGDPVYQVPSGKLYNQAIVYGPDGALLGRMRKVYLTDPEHGDLGIDGHLPERLGPIDLEGVASITSLISRDAWMPDAQERVALAGAEVVLQHEAFSTWTTPAEGHPWPADNLKRSGWGAVQKHPELRAAAAPMLVGNFFDVPFDGQTFIAEKGRPSAERRELLAQAPDTGWAAIGPWVVEDPESGSLAERRAALRAAGEALLPGGADENGYVEGTVWADITIPRDGGYPPVPDAAPGEEAPVLGPSVAVAPSGTGRQRSAAPLVLEDGAVALAWEDTRFCTGQILFARSDDGGESFSDPVRVAPWDRPQHSPALVALPGGALVLAWQEILGEGRAEIRVSSSEDGGATWSHRRRVDPENAVDAWKPALAADPETGALYLAFVDSRGEAPNRRVYLARSDDGGETFSTPVRLDPRERPSSSPDRTLANEWSPALAAGGGRVLAAYTHRNRRDPEEQPSFDVFVVESDDGGETFSTPRRLDDGGFPERLAADVSLAMGESGWRVAFSTYRGTAPDAEVAHLAGGDESLSFAPDVDPGRDQWWPSLAPLGGGGFALAWQDFRSGGNDIYLARVGGGAAEALRIDDAGDSDAHAWRPRVATGPGGEVYVFWEDSRSGRAEIRVAGGSLPAEGEL